MIKKSTNLTGENMCWMCSCPWMEVRDGHGTHIQASLIPLPWPAQTNKQWKSDKIGTNIKMPARPTRTLFIALVIL